MSSLGQIAVIGGGSWATALVKIIQDSSPETKINWWLRGNEKAAYIQEHGQNPDYLRDVHLDRSRLHCSADIAQTIAESNTLILAIPSAFVHSSLSSCDSTSFKDKTVLSAVKGLIPETSEILGDYLKTQKGLSAEQIGVITGPCHAEEVALEKLSYLTIASENRILATEVAQLLAGDYIETTTSDDIYGTEYSAVLKNVYAIAAGIFHGLGYGDNFLAVLVSNAIREIKRFIEAVHPIDRDIDDSAYLGDLIVTAYSKFSRNRTFGNMLGRGYSVKAAQIEMKMIAEGYYAVKTVHEMNEKLGVSMPLADFVYSVVYEEQKPKGLVNSVTKQLN